MSEAVSADPGSSDRALIKRRLQRSMRWRRLRALALVAPLLAFVLIAFAAPIGDMLFRSVENSIVSDTMPRTTHALSDWKPTTGQVLGEAVYGALYVDLSLAVASRRHTRVGSRLNYETTGIASLFRKSGRGIRKIDIEQYRSTLADINAGWLDRAWVERVLTSSGTSAALRGTLAAFRQIAPADDPVVPSLVHVALLSELSNLPINELDAISGEVGDHLRAVHERSDGVLQLKRAFIEMDPAWGEENVWATLSLFSPNLTEGYFLNAVDMKKDVGGAVLRDPGERLYVKIFIRTLIMSLVITSACILLGYPVAYLLANLPTRRANLLMILVLLPFWTSLLVRTSAWKVLLQNEGVINDLLVSLGIIAETGRLAMINNQFGTIVAMTHILLPFMILPIYSVMKTISPSYVRAARSLGATSFTAFRRIYFPQTAAGIGAGSILVFILSIGYYITPELVGGTTGTFISNRIAYHVSSSLNWGLAAALGTILLVVVIALYWIYDRLVGIDKVKLG